MILAPVLLECLLAARSAFQSQQSLPIPNHGVLVEIVKMTGCAGGRSRAEEMLRTSLLLALLGKRRCLMLPLDSFISLTYFFTWQFRPPNYICTPTAGTKLCGISVHPLWFLMAVDYDNGIGV